MPKNLSLLITQDVSVESLWESAGSTPDSVARLILGLSHLVPELGPLTRMLPRHRVLANPPAMHSRRCQSLAASCTVPVANAVSIHGRMIELR